MIRTSTLGSFCPYTLPFPHSGQRSPCVSFWCLISTFRAPPNAPAPLRPCPGNGVALLSGFVPVWESSCFPTTALVFSVLRVRTNSAASACSAVSELAVIGLAQRRFPRSVQYPVQILQVHVEAASCSL